jgi:hypothetical protein
VQKPKTLGAQQHQNAVAAAAAAQLHSAAHTLIPLGRKKTKLNSYNIRAVLYYCFIQDEAFFQANSDPTWSTPHLAFDLGSTGLTTLIPTLHPAHIQVRVILLSITSY